MPTFKNPCVRGNLFVIFSIQFPDSLSPDAERAMRAMLPGPLNVATYSADDEGVEVHETTDMDPVASLNTNKANMVPGGEAYDEDDDARGTPGAAAGCQQM